MNIDQYKYLTKFTNLSLFEIKEIKKNTPINEVKQLLKDRYKILEMEHSTSSNILNRGNYISNNDQHIQQQIKQSFQYYNTQFKLQLNQMNQNIESLKQQLEVQQRQLQINEIGLNLF